MGNLSEVMSTKDKIRKSPYIIFDYDDIRGVQNAFKSLLEIFSVEASRGHADMIEVELFRDLSVSVRLCGKRAIRLGEIGDDGEIWKQRFAEFYTGEKDYNEFLFGDTDGESSLQSELCYDRVDIYPYLALNQFVTEFMSVTSYCDTDKMAKTIQFRHGENERPLTECDYPFSGTCIHLRYDPCVFSDITLNKKFLSSLLGEAALINRGIKYVLHTENEEGNMDREVFCFEKYADYIRQIAGDTLVLPVFEDEISAVGKDRALNSRTYTAKVSVLAGITKGSSAVNCFYNGHRLDNGGAFLDEFYKAVQKKVNIIAGRNSRFDPVTVRELKKRIVVTIDIRTIGCLPHWSDGRRSCLENGMISELVREVCQKELDNRLLADADAVIEGIVDVIMLERKRDELENSLYDNFMNAVTDCENGDGKGALTRLLINSPRTQASYDIIMAFSRKAVCLCEPLYYYILLLDFAEFLTTEDYNHLLMAYTKHIGKDLPKIFVVTEMFKGLM